MDTAPEPGMPDDRDWTTVLDGGCDECGYRPHDPPSTGDRLAAAAERWRAVLTRPDVGRRPAPRVWSPLEYAGHCRDLIEVLGDRLESMLDGENPTYADFRRRGCGPRERVLASRARGACRTTVPRHHSDPHDPRAGLRCRLAAYGASRGRIRVHHRLIEPVHRPRHRAPPPRRRRMRILRTDGRSRRTG